MIACVLLTQPWRQGMLEDLRKAPEGSILLLHACAHNPTGAPRLGLLSMRVGCSLGPIVSFVQPCACVASGALAVGLLPKCMLSLVLQKLFF